MNWFSSKYRALAEDLAVELEQTKQTLNLERARRISAEAVSEERRQRCDRAEESEQRARAACDAAILERLKSVDLTNSTLLNVLNPQQGPDIKSFTHLKPIEKQKRQGIPMRRQMEHNFIRQAIRQSQGVKAPLPKEGDAASVLEHAADAVGLLDMVTTVKR